MQKPKATSFADDLAGVAPPRAAEGSFEADLAALASVVEAPKAKAPVRMVDFKDGQRPDTGTVTPGELALRMAPIALGVGGRLAPLALARVAAPKAIGTKEVATGFVDEFGRPMMKAVTEYGPSMLSRIGSAAATAAPKAIKSAAKLGALGAGGTALYRFLGGK